MKWIELTIITCLACLASVAQPSGPGSALSFNGSGSVAISTTGSLTGTFTVELWANPAINSPADLLALLGARTPGEFAFDMKFWLGHLIHGDIGDGTTWFTTAADAEYHYVPGDWVHIAYVVTPTNYNIYANGQFMSGGDYAPGNPVLYDANHQLTIAHIGSGSEYMTGQIDEVRIWNTARAASEIQTNLQRRLSGAEAGLMGYWRFDEGSGTFIDDSSGHGFTGLLSGGAVWVSSTAPIDALTATTAPATAISGNSARLNGTVFPNNQNAFAWFEYGPTPDYGMATAPMQIDGSNGTPVPMSTSVGGLTLGVEYHFRLLATNNAGRSEGGDLSFTATAMPLVQNAGFETGDFTGWTESGNTIDDSVVSNPQHVHSGAYAAQLGPTGALGYLSQVLATTPGQAYILSFWLSGDGAMPNEYSVSWDGTPLSENIDVPAMGWTLLQFNVVASSSSTTLQFAFRDDSGYWWLDDVSVVTIPAPEFIGGPVVQNGAATLTWSSVAGQVYEVQYTTSLNPPVWNILGLPLIATGDTMTLSDPNGNDPQRFYRVVLLP